jgi:hypothetical protein
MMGDKMKVTEIPLGENESVKCPICGHEWRNAEMMECSPCQHLRFHWFENAPIETFGRWAKRDFNRRYIRAYKAEVDADSDNDSILENPSSEAFEGMSHNSIDAVLYVVYSGMACGPVSFVAYFGIQKP